MNKARLLEIAQKQRASHPMFALTPKVPLDQRTSHLEQCNARECDIETVEVFFDDPSGDGVVWTRYSMGERPKRSFFNKAGCWAFYLCKEYGLWHECGEDDCCFNNDDSRRLIYVQERGEYICPISTLSMGHAYIASFTPGAGEAHNVDNFGRVVNQQEAVSEPAYSPAPKRLNAHVPSDDYIMDESLITRYPQYMSTSTWYKQLTLDHMNTRSSVLYQRLYLQARMVIFQYLCSSKRVVYETNQARNVAAKIQQKSKGMIRAAQRDKRPVVYLDHELMKYQYTVADGSPFFRYAVHMADHVTRDRIIRYYALRAIELWKNVVFLTEIDISTLPPRESFIAALFIMKNGLKIKPEENVIIAPDRFLSVFLPGLKLLNYFTPRILEGKITTAVHTMISAITINIFDGKHTYRDFIVPTVPMQRILEERQTSVEVLYNEYVSV
jgi:hypothetical protein